MKQSERYKNPDNDTRGPWTAGDFTARNPYDRPAIYPIDIPYRPKNHPVLEQARYWRVIEEQT